jgi:galactonate dehydratase
MTARLKITAVKSYPAPVGTRHQLLVMFDIDQGIADWGKRSLSGGGQADPGPLPGPPKSEADRPQFVTN